MLVFRTDSSLPVFLTRLPFIRRWRPLIAPVEEDIASLREYASGQKDISEMQSPHSFMVAADLPDLNAVQRGIERGEYKSSATLRYDVFGWTAADVARILRYDEDEADTERKVRDEDFDRDFVPLLDRSDIEMPRLRDMSCPVSVLPFIDDWQRYDLLRQRADPMARTPHIAVDSASHLTRSERLHIETEEQMAFELLRAQGRHRRLTRGRGKGSGASDSLRAGEREEILRLDNYTCFFSGATSPAEIDVHHIVSRKIIEILDLPRELLTARYNLIAVESQLNRAKGAKLFRQDVEVYFERFASASHRNHEILSHLTRIKSLQDSIIDSAL